MENTQLESTALRRGGRVFEAVRTVEGAGFVVRRPFPTMTLDHFDPFLLLDHMGPMDLAPGEAKGAPDHPHRGFETVTYLLDGEFEHADSAGHRGRLGPGDVQWMTAGAGVVHSEMPSTNLQRLGGRLQGVQLWVNLPRRDKLMAPRYQEIPSESIPTAEADGGRVRVRVIAGEALGTKAVIETRTPIAYQHWTLKAGGRALQPIPRDWNAFAYVLRGAGTVGGKAVKEAQMVMLAPTGDEVELRGPDSDGEVDLLLLAGQPLREPVARYGPFVMNTRDELLQAFQDYESGKMGRIGH
jgi:hypothetical protein